jgi:hypothetical protein
LSAAKSGIGVAIGKSAPGFRVPLNPGYDAALLCGYFRQFDALQKLTSRARGPPRLLQVPGGQATARLVLSGDTRLSLPRAASAGVCTIAIAEAISTRTKIARISPSHHVKFAVHAPARPDVGREGYRLLAPNAMQGRSSPHLSAVQ